MTYRDHRRRPLQIVALVPSCLPAALGLISVIFVYWQTEPNPLVVGVFLASLMFCPIGAIVASVVDLWTGRTELGRVLSIATIVWNIIVLGFLAYMLIRGPGGD